MWCPRCQCDVQTYTQAIAGPNHVLHALLTFFLCGLWLPVWIIIALADSRRRSMVRCSRCGLGL